MGRDGKLVTSFADMGTQAPEILNNGNRKLFFILIDPTSEGREQAFAGRGRQPIEEPYVRQGRRAQS